jgi:hypothetical protein
VAGDPLVEQSHVEAVLLRSLTTTEAQFINTLCEQASALLRVRRHTIDTRIALWDTSPDEPTAVNPDVVAAMLATVIKRAMVNPRGLWSTSETDGDYSYSETYPGQRSGTDGGTPGEIVIVDSDLAKIDGSSFGYRRPIRTLPAWLQ